MAIYACIEQCIGCDRANGRTYSASEDDQHLLIDATCDRYMRPYAKWGKLGGCEGATHVKRETAPQQKQRVGQQKQKKGH